MHISCSTIAEFIHCLREDRVKGVWQNTVRYAQYENKVPDKPATDFSFQATAIMIEDEGSYLLELGVDCGRDKFDGEPELLGSTGMAAAHADISAVCKELNLRLMPGVIHE